MKRFLASPARRMLVGCGATLILAAAAVGIAGAQQTPGPSTTPPGQTQTQTARPNSQAFLAALAKRLNITTDQLTQAIPNARSDAGLPAGNGFPGPGGRGPG